ncbi:hypothetical protein [Psychromonas ossibalaenae]|uniref:hypothetical protein n=1 Tax=Psychromonas ossibalaenae TaxID=444922 RepID=UPI000374BE1B|nr:hypothetical protein [Psychromonas ossibalaenae]
MSQIYAIPYIKVSTQFYGTMIIAVQSIRSVHEFSDAGVICFNGVTRDNGSIACSHSCQNILLAMDKALEKASSSKMGCMVTVEVK